MREPHEPQNANVACTIFPQVGQGISPAAGAAAAGRVAAGAADTVAASAGPPSGVDEEVRPGDMVGFPGAAGGAASGLGGSWNEAGGPNGAGILGESFQGMPLLGFGVGADGRSSPAATLVPPNPPPVGADGSTVRAVSRSNGVTEGAGGEAAGLGVGAGAGAALASSFPHPKQNL
jgi:hypothetical protein